MRWKWLVCVIMALAAIGAVAAMSCRIAEQSDEIEAMDKEIHALRHDAEFWPALIRVELVRMEARLKAWWIHGAERR